MEKPMCDHINKMQKITPIYIVLEADLLVELNMKVNDYLNKGYVPQGGICACYSPHSCSSRKYYQAMTKGLT